MIGIDGCRAGWFVARFDSRGWTGTCVPSISALTESWDPGSGVMLIDIPIGLPDDTSSRSCDRAARRYLGGARASSVLNPPTRRALAATSWEEAAEINRRTCGKRISKQSWGIVPKIREVDRWMRADPTRQDRLREAHPEVLFAALNGGTSLLASKRSDQGREARLRLLEARGGGATEFFDDAVRSYPRSTVRRDDVLDAMCLALVAARHGDRLTTMPAVPPVDSAGLRCEIVLPGGGL